MKSPERKYAEILVKEVERGRGAQNSGLELVLASTNPGLKSV